VEHGLSQSSVRAITQDEWGFIWLFTQDGMNRYDGMNFEIFRHQTNKPKHQVPSNSYFFDVAKDKSGNLWIASNKGLNQYNPYTNTFQTFYHLPDNKNSLPNNRLQAIRIDSKGCIWIGTERGLSCYNPVSTEFTNFFYESDNVNSICSNEILSLFVDGDSIIWIGTDKGLCNYDLRTQQFNRVEEFCSHTKSVNPVINCIVKDFDNKLWIGTDKGLFTLKNKHLEAVLPEIQDEVNDILISSSGLLWIGTQKTGLYSYETNIKHLEKYTHNDYDVESIGSNTVNTIFEDNTGILWVGLQAAGVSRLDPLLQQFKVLKNIPNGTVSLTSSYITSIFADSVGRILIGTNNGLNKIGRKRKEIKKYFDDVHFPRRTIWSITKQKDKLYWLGTEQGIILFDCGKDTYKEFPLISEKNNERIARCMFIDENNILWVGTYSGGIFLFDIETEKFIKNYRANGKIGDIPHNKIYCFKKDSKGEIWIGTAAGLAKFNKETETFTQWKSDKNNPNSLAGDMVLDIVEDANYQFWIATYDGGFCQFDPIKNKFRVYGQENEMNQEAAYNILLDKKSNLWISTNNGILHFDQHTQKIKRFSVAEGLQSAEFNVGAATLAKDGTMYFGGIGGVTFFQPEKIQNNPHKPKVIITHFKKFDKEVVADSSIFCKKKSIQLKHTDSFFSVDFIALNYTNPAKNTYQYRLLGLDEDWINAGNRHYVSYTDLEEGDYIFEVRAANNDGLWSTEPTQLKISIAPPLYKQTWFKWVSFTLIAACMLFVYTIRIKAIRKQNEKLEHTIKERTKDLHMKNIVITEQQNELQRQKNSVEVINKQLEKLLHEIQDKNAQVMESIEYAVRIQEAILPIETELKKLLPNSLVYFKPRDEVSGDFYWCTEKAGKILVAVADCTGHGVPGALMSVIGYTQLEKITDSLSSFDPALLLEELDSAVQKIVRQDDIGRRNGMDMALLVIDAIDNYVDFAGAFRPMWLVNAEGKLQEYAATRRAIGIRKQGKENIKFVSHRIELNINDCIYIFSDGFADQFGGGANAKKYTSKRFKSFLANIAHLPGGVQQAAIQQEFNDWKGNHFQIDDVLVIGIKI
jgi:ligand-binding sensor domain-containing protein/serine phosphatase RsbU (regulator of sigma subunit)